MANKMGIGVIGCGSISAVHLAAIDAIEEVTLIAVCDKEPAKVDDVLQRYPCQGTTEIEALLDMEAIDWVHILTPHYCHVDMAIAAMRKGKHVILEKPVGINRESLTRLKEVRDETGARIAVVLQNRFNPTSLAIKAYTESDKLGSYISGKGSVTWSRDDAYYQESPWRGQKETEGGGVLINQAIHTLDLMSFLTSRVNALRGDVGNYDHPYNDVEDMAMIQLRHESGAESLFFASNNFGTNSPVSLEFHYEKGILELNHHVAYLIQGGERQVLATDYVDQGMKSYWGKGHEACIRYIYNRPDRDMGVVSLEEGLHATDLVLTTYAAAIAQSWVTLEHH